MLSFHLTRGDVHAWDVKVDVPPCAYARLYAALTSDERGRAARFRFEQDRRRFVVAHGVLRELLGRYLGVHPAELQFSCNAAGKPALAPEFGRWLNFSLTHSADLALIAVAADAEVGVDVERIRALTDASEIAERFFSPAELAALRGLPTHIRTYAFFNCWTKKEAYVKACGEGLGMPFEDFSVPLASDPVLIGQGRRWSLYSLHPAPGYVGALAVEGSGWRMTLRSWQS